MCFFGRGGDAIRSLIPPTSDYRFIANRQRRRRFSVVSGLPNLNLRIAKQVLTKLDSLLFHLVFFFKIYICTVINHTKILRKVIDELYSNEYGSTEIVMVKLVYCFIVHFDVGASMSHKPAVRLWFSASLYIISCQVGVEV